jgi:hypothetical protein
LGSIARFFKIAGAMPPPDTATELRMSVWAAEDEAKALLLLYDELTMKILGKVQWFESQPSWHRRNGKA